MRILIFLNESYPYGMACTNRTHLYAKGLSELGNEILIVIPIPKDNRERANNLSAKGIYEKVKFIYSWSSSLRSSHFIIRRLHDFLGPIISLGYSIRFKPDFIILVSDSFYHNIIAKLIRIFTSCKLIVEQTEVPYHKKDSISKLDFLKIKIRFWGVKGVILISNPLQLYFKNVLRINKDVLTIPIIIDDVNTDLFEISMNHLVYSGSISDKHADIFLVLEAVKRLSAEFNNITLFITGNKTDSPDLGKIYSFIQNNSLEDRIIFTGYLSKEELHKLTKSALALLALKPDNRQNRYNMATKTGEYLLSGRPVIISNVDTLANFLTNRENAFIVKPEINTLFREIKFILNNPEVANKVGLNGKHFGLKELNYKLQTERLNNFLLKLKWGNSLN